MTDRDLDVVVHGATGFVGRLVAERLAATAPSGTRIALSGRSADRVRAVRDDLGPAAADWPVLVADSHDGAALADLAARTRAVASTVGPYAEHGTPLVLACAAAGTSYADLTGEATFVRESIDAAHARAADTGARIVHSAGFDSVPSDLAVLLLADAARTAGAGGLANTTLVVGDSRGGLSGGTIASLVGQLDAARTDARAARLFAAPASLDPGWAPDLAVPVGPPTDLDPSFRSGALGGWVAPWVMAPHNARIVRRSAALAAAAGTGYGPDFRYREVISTGGGPVAPGGRGGGVRRGPRRERRSRLRTGARPGGPGAPGGRVGSLGPDAGRRAVQHPDGDAGRRRLDVVSDRGRAARPRLPRHRGDAGRDGARAGAGRRPAPGRRRGPHPGDRGRHRPGRPAARRRHDHDRRAGTVPVLKQAADPARDPLRRRGPRPDPRTREGRWRRPGSSDMTTIGFIGSGNIGSTLARLAVDRGYDVVMSNSRAPETLAELVADLGPHARAATRNEAAEAGDLVVVSIPLHAYRQVPPAPLAGKVVVDTDNYYPERDGIVPELEDGSATTSGLHQAHLADSEVVKAFNNIWFKDLGRGGKPAGSPGRRALPVASDHPEAKRRVMDLVEEFGFDAVDAGTLADSSRFERDKPAYVAAFDVAGLREALAQG